MEKSGHTFFETIGNNQYDYLWDIRHYANIRKLPTSIEYLKEIEARLWYLVFSSSSIYVGEHTTILSYKSKRDNVNDMLDNMYKIYEWVLTISGTRKLFSTLAETYISYTGSEGITTFSNVLTFIFKKEDVLNHELAKIGIPEFVFDPVFLEEEWLMYKVMYKDNYSKSVEYDVFKKNWLWVKENTKCIIVSKQIKEVKEIKEVNFFFNTKHIKPDQEKSNDFLNKSLNTCNLNNLFMCKYVCHDEYDQMNLRHVLNMEHSEMKKCLESMM
jgi:hypothetical protein